MEYFILSNGLRLPAVGSGTNSFGKRNQDFRGEIIGDWTPVYSAVEAGYELFDTAVSYGNEEGIGQTLHEAAADRNKLFIIGKIPPPKNYETDVIKYTYSIVSNSLKCFHTDYLDLCLIHRPWEDTEGMLEMWLALHQMVQTGIIRGMGVSNHDADQIEFLYKNSGFFPAVNQIQINPRCWNDELVKYCLDRNIRPMAWGPLTGVEDDFRTILSGIGSRYQKSWAQVLLRFDYQRGICTIPKSHVKENQLRNLQIFDFELSRADMADIYDARK